RALAAPVVDRSPFGVLANLDAVAQARLALKTGEADRARRLLQAYQGDDGLALTRYWHARAQGRSALASYSRTAAALRLRAYGEWAAERPPVLEALRPPPAGE
ncbi:MAG: hypothetical protein NDI59_07830, partial [Lysobacter sp.]|nr:hypothetical protein [Lysobacter sp.]